MQPQLGRLTGGNAGAGGRSAYLNGGAIATGAPAPLTGTQKLISVLPSILAAGASFVPGVGTAAAAGLGAIGEAARENLSGENIDFGKIATEAGLSAIPGGLGKIGELAKAAKGINITRDGLQAASKGGDLASAIGDANTVAKTSAAGKAAAQGNKILASQYGAIPNSLAKSVNVNDTVGKLASIGITKPQDAERIAAGATGANGLVTKAVAKAAGSAGSVPTGEIAGRGSLDSVVNDAIQNNGLAGNDAKSVLATVRGKMTQLLGGPNAKISGNANPSDALGVMKSLEGRIAQLRQTAAANPSRADQANVLQALHNEIQDRLYNVAGANQNLSKVLTPGLRNSLVALHPGNASWIDHVDNVIMKSPDVGALRSSMKPLVDISKVINSADTTSSTVGGKIASSLSPKGIVSTIANATIGSQPVKQAAAGLLRGENGVVNTAKTIAKGTPQAALIAGPTIARAQGTPTQTPTAQDVAAQLPSDQTANAPTDNSNNGMFSPSVLQAMALHDIQTTGGKNLDKITQLNNLFGAGAKTQQTQSAAQQQKKSDISDALSYLDTAEQQVKQFGGPQGPAGATADIPVLGQFINPGAAAYNKTKIDIATAVAKALTGSARPAASVIKQFAESLPGVTDTPQVAAQKLANLRLELKNKQATLSQ